jgi:hypothetical protein
MPRLFFGTIAALSLLLTSACAVVETAGAVVSTAASVTGTVVETTVDAVTYPVRD